MLQMMFDDKPPTDMFPMLSVDDLAELPQPEWLLENRLPEGQTWVYGEPGVGKTFVVLDWAASVAAHGNRVIYCLGEGVKGFSKRVLAWRKAHPEADLRKFSVIPMTPQLLDSRSAEAFQSLIAKNEPRLVVIDTFARASVGGDENSAKDMGQAISVLDTIYRVNDCSSLVVHHSQKSGGSERGSGAIRGAADATWEIVPDYTHPGMHTLQAICRKMKDSEPPRPVLAQLRPSEDSAVTYPSAL